MKEVTAPLIRYRLKAEFKDLFTNLASGEIKFQKEAFNNPEGINRKSYASEEEAREHRIILRKLVDAGFLEEISTPITYLERG
jgi:hypothetical protein